MNEFLGFLFYLPFWIIRKLFCIFTFGHTYKWLKIVNDNKNKYYGCWKCYSTNYEVKSI